MDVIDRDGLWTGLEFVPDPTPAATLPANRQPLDCKNA